MHPIGSSPPSTISAAVLAATSIGFVRARWCPTSGRARRIRLRRRNRRARARRRSSTQIAITFGDARRDQGPRPLSLGQQREVEQHVFAEVRRHDLHADRQTVDRARSGSRSTGCRRSWRGSSRRPDSTARPRPRRSRSGRGRRPGRRRPGWWPRSRDRPDRTASPSSRCSRCAGARCGPGRRDRTNPPRARRRTGWRGSGRGAQSGHRSPSWSRMRAMPPIAHS